MNDLISRELAMKELFEAFGKYPNSFSNGIGTARKIISELPAMDAAPVVHGRWVDADGNNVGWMGDMPNSPRDSCICSVCHAWLVASDEYSVCGLYCPHCGAKMDGGKSE